MDPLTRWLTLLHEDCKFKVRFNTLDKEHYEQEWESLNKSCVPVKAPEFFCKNVELGEVSQDLSSTYVQVLIENAGYKQPHEFLLTGIMKVNAFVQLYFSSIFSNWGIKRVVVIDLEHNKVTRNDFNDVYELSWKDYREGEYQKKKATPHVSMLRRPTLTQLNK